MQARGVEGESDIAEDRTLATRSYFLNRHNYRVL
jgi:hypothetical protein